MTNDDLMQLAGLLSDYEREQLLALVTDVVGGERPWEEDVGVFYNDYVKLRSVGIGDDPSLLVPGGDDADDGDGIYAPIPLTCAAAPETAPIDLPVPGEIDLSLTQALLARRSRRDFGSSPLPLETLSTLLSYAAGVRGHGQAYGYRRFPLRTFPSAGGLQSPELYLFVRAVEELEAGIYHYQPLQHALEPVGAGDHSTTLRALGLGQYWLETAAAVLGVTGRYDRLRWKYSERAYRYMCIDAGFLGANVYLVGEALSLGVCAIAGFLDDPIQSLLRVDGRDELVLMLMALGPRP